MQRRVVTRAALKVLRNARSVRTVEANLFG